MSVPTLIFAASCISLGVWLTDFVPYGRAAKVTTGVLWIINGIVALLPILVS